MAQSHWSIKSNRGGESALRVGEVTIGEVIISFRKEHPHLDCNCESNCQFNSGSLI